MDYFNSENTTHNLTFIHRSFEPIVTLTIWHELTNIKSVIEDIECYLDNGYSYIIFDFEFIVGSYTIEITSTDKLIYRSKAKAI
jgi:hypothetical protein